MSADSEYKSPEDFLKKLDSGQLDDNLTNEVKKLSPKLLDEVASTLMDREGSPEGPGISPGAPPPEPIE